MQVLARKRKMSLRLPITIAIRKSKKLAAVLVIFTLVNASSKTL